MDKYIIPKTISEVILSQDEKFTEKDIYNKVKIRLEKYFPNADTMKKYIKKKLISMSEYNLIGRTECYYFPR